MAADDKILIEIELDDGTIKKGFAKIETQAKQAGDSVNKSFSGGVLTSLRGSFLGISAAIGAVAAAAGGIALFSRAVREASNQEDAINELNTALLLSGKYSESASKNMQNFASSLQEVTKFGDDVTLRTSALIQGLGQLDEEGLKRATKAALDLSTALRIDVNAAATLVGKAATGEVSSFTRYGIAIKKTGDAAKDFGAALDLIESKFGGASEQALKTFSGSTQALSNNFGDLLEVLGNVIVKSPVIIKLTNLISESFVKVGKVLSNALEGSDPIGSLIIKVVSFAEAVNTFIVAPLEIAFNVIRVVFNGLEVSFQSFIGVIAGLASGIVNIFAPNSELAKSLNAFKESADKTFVDLADNAYENMSKIFDFDFSTKSAEFLENLNRNLQSTGEALSLKIDVKTPGKEEIEQKLFTVSDAFSSFSNGFVMELERLRQTSDQAFNSIGKSMTQTLANGAGNAFASFGKAIVKGENALGAFANSMISALGGAAVQLGSMFILQGLAYSFAGMPNGPALIGAGAALAALGGILSAVSPTAGTTDVTGGAGSTTLAGPDVASDELLQAEPQRQNSITINVQGDVLDSDESGLRIAQLLQKEIDRSGTSIIAVT